MFLWLDRSKRFRVYDKFQKKYIFTGFHVIGEITCFGLIDAVIKETYDERMKMNPNLTSSIEMWNDFILEQSSLIYDCTSWNELPSHVQEEKNREKDNWKGIEIYEGDIISIGENLLSCPSCYKNPELKDQSFCAYCGKELITINHNNLAVVILYDGSFHFDSFDIQQCELYEHNFQQTYLYYPTTHTYKNNYENKIVVPTSGNPNLVKQFPVRMTTQKIQVVGNVNENPNIIPKILFDWYHFNGA